MMNTWAPSLTRSLAAARPIPVVPPVITAVFPASLFMSEIPFAVAVELGSGSGLGGFGASPKRSRVYTVWIDAKHPIVELTGGGRLPAEANEVADILSGLADVTRGVVRIKRPVADDDRSRLERLDLVDGYQPVQKPSIIRLDHVGMRAVVDGVPGDRQGNRGDMQTSCVISIGVANINRD